MKTKLRRETPCREIADTVYEPARLLMRRMMAQVIRERAAVEFGKTTAALHNTQGRESCLNNLPPKAGTVKV